ncbi:unnamed protein product, partial [Rotaria magnacalcarata]
HKEQPFVTAQDVTNQLERRGVAVSERTICRRFNEAGARYSRPIPKPLLTERHRQNRLRWAQHHKATDWNQVLRDTVVTSLIPPISEVLHTTNVTNLFQNKLNFTEIIQYDRSPRNYSQPALSANVDKNKQLNISTTGGYGDLHRNLSSLS